MGGEWDTCAGVSRKQNIPYQPDQKKSLSEISLTTSMKPESCQDANFVTTGGTGGCHYDNLLCHQLWQSWHHDNFKNSLFTTLTTVGYHSNGMQYLFDCMAWIHLPDIQGAGIFIDISVVIPIIIFIPISTHQPHGDATRIMFKLISRRDIRSIFCEIGLWWLP